MIRRFVSNEFSEEYISTIGVRVSAKMIELGNESLKLMIWDVAGTKDDEKVPKSYFLGAHAAMYVFDLQAEETYLKIEERIQEIKELSGLDRFLIVGNKRDLLSDEELSRVLSRISIPVDLATSAKEGTGVEEAFLSLANQSLN